MSTSHPNFDGDAVLISAAVNLSKLTFALDLCDVPVLNFRRTKISALRTRVRCTPVVVAASIILRKNSHLRKNKYSDKPGPFY